MTVQLSWTSWRGEILTVDVNVLLHAHREELPNHARIKAWFDEVVNSPESFALSDLVLSSFVRVVSNPKVFQVPTPTDQAIALTSVLRERENCVVIRPGLRHWGIFVELCLKSGARGNLVADAYLAALAIESGCEWITTDRDFARFPGLRWRHPLEAA